MLKRSGNVTISSVSVWVLTIEKTTLSLLKGIKFSLVCLFSFTIIQYSRYVRNERLEGPSWNYIQTVGDQSQSAVHTRSWCPRPSSHEDGCTSFNTERDFVRIFRNFVLSRKARLLLLPSTLICQLKLCAIRTFLGRTKIICLWCNWIQEDS